MDALNIVMRLGNGHLVEDIAEALVEVAEEVVLTGKPGQVNVVLKLSNREAGDVMVIVQDQVARKPPTKDPRGTYLYAVEGGLWARDPRQTELEFRAVESQEPEVRDLDDAKRIVREG